MTESPFPGQELSIEEGEEVALFRVEPEVEVKGSFRGSREEEEEADSLSGGREKNEREDDDGGEGEEEIWEAQKLETQFGTTDDVVTLKNGKTFYFFKLPHKV